MEFLTKWVKLNSAEEMVKIAFECDFNIANTAIGFGESQQILGSFRVSNFKVVKKHLPLP